MRLTEAEKKERILDKWRQKGIEEAIKRLWKVQEKLDALTVENIELRKKLDNATVGFKHVINENETLKDVLQDNGIRPRKLRVTYRRIDCQNCEHTKYDKCWGDDEEPDCLILDMYPDGHRCIWRNIVERISFYTYKIDKCTLIGIREDFRTWGYNVIEVVDEATGKTIFKLEAA